MTTGLNFDVTPKEQALNIQVDGKTVGSLRPLTDGRWQATLEPDPNVITLLNGFGETHQEAIVDAITGGRNYAQQRLRLIDDLAAMLGYKEPPSLGAAPSPTGAALSPDERGEAILSAYDADPSRLHDRGLDQILNDVERSPQTHEMAEAAQ